jgi:hypothetical protein
MSWEDEETKPVTKKAPSSWEDEDEEDVKKVEPKKSGKDSWEETGKKAPSSWEAEEGEGEGEEKKTEPKKLSTTKQETKSSTTKKDSEEKPKDAKKASTTTAKQEAKQPATSNKKNTATAKPPTTTLTPTSPQTNLSKQMQQKMVEEEDLNLSHELFSGINQAVNLKQPKDEKDFEGVGEEVANKLSIYQQNKHFPKLVKALLRKLGTNMKIEDLHDLSATLNALANEKMKAEKDRPKKKNKGTKLNIEFDGKGKDAFGPIPVKSEGAFDEETDFM